MKIKFGEIFEKEILLSQDDKIVQHVLIADEALSVYSYTFAIAYNQPNAALHLLRVRAG